MHNPYISVVIPVHNEQEVLEELYRYFPGKIFRSVIPRSIRLAEAPSFGKTIFKYDPDSKAAKAYERLAREFLMREVGAEM